MRPARRRPTSASTAEKSTDEATSQKESVAANQIGIINPGYLAPLFTTTKGQICLVGMLIMMVAAALILKKIVTIKG